MAPVRDESDVADERVSDSGDDGAVESDGTVDEGDAEGDRALRHPPGWRRLDATSIVLCTLVALVAAVLAGILVTRLTDEDAGGADESSTLTAAENAPSVEFERFDGSPVSLDDYRGQPLVVNFWGTWCEPCIKEMPDLQRVHRGVGESVTILGVNVRDDVADAEAMAETTGVTYDLARDPDGALIRALELTQFPTTLLIQADGTIVDRVYAQIPAAQLCDKINQSLLAGALTECV